MTDQAMSAIAEQFAPLDHAACNTLLATLDERDAAKIRAALDEDPGACHAGDSMGDAELPHGTVHKVSPRKYGPRYDDCAAIQAIEAHLREERAALRRQQRLVTALEQLAERRQKQIADGSWATHPGDPIDRAERTPCYYGT